MSKKVAVPTSVPFKDFLTYDKAEAAGVKPQVPAIDGVTGDKGTFANKDIEVLNPETSNYKFKEFRFTAEGSSTSSVLDVTQNIVEPGTITVVFHDQRQATRFADTSWTDIISHANNGFDDLKNTFISEFESNNNTFVGLKHPVYVYENPDKPTEATTYQVSVIGECVDDVVDDGGQKTGQKATLTLQFDNLVESSIGWGIDTKDETKANKNSNSNLRKFLTATFPSKLTFSSAVTGIDNLLPYSGIQKVAKKTAIGHYDGAETEVPTEENNEKFFVLSMDEMDYLASEKERIESNKSAAALIGATYAREGYLYPYFDTYHHTLTGSKANDELSTVYGFELGNDNYGSIGNDQYKKALGVTLNPGQDRNGNEIYDYWTRSPFVATTGSAYSLIDKYIETEAGEYNGPYISTDATDEDVKTVKEAAGVAPAFCIGKTDKDAVPAIEAKITLPKECAKFIDSVTINGQTFTSDENNDVVINLADTEKFGEKAFKGVRYNKDDEGNGQDIEFTVVSKTGKCLGTGFQGFLELFSGKGTGVSPFIFANNPDWDITNEETMTKDNFKNAEFSLPMEYGDATKGNINRVGMIEAKANGDEFMKAVVSAQTSTGTKLNYSCRIPSDFMSSSFNIPLFGTDIVEANVLTLITQSHAASNISVDGYNLTEGEAGSFTINKVDGAANIDPSKIRVSMSVYSAFGNQEYSYTIEGTDNISISEVTAGQQYTVNLTAAGTTINSLLKKSITLGATEIHVDYVLDTDPNPSAVSGTELQAQGLKIQKAIGTPVYMQPYMFIVAPTSGSGITINPEGLYVEYTVDGTTSQCKTQYVPLDDGMYLIWIDGGSVKGTLVAKYKG